MSDNNNNNKSSYSDTFYIVPRYIRKLPGMTMAFLDVYETIYQFWNKGFTCFLSNKAIGERTGVSERQIKEAILFFEKLGELKREKKGLKRFLIRPERTIETEEGATAPTSTNITQEGAGAPPTSTNNSTNITQEGAPAPRAGRWSAPVYKVECKEVEVKNLTTSLSFSLSSKKEKEKEKENASLPANNLVKCLPEQKMDENEMSYKDTYFPLPIHNGGSQQVVERTFMAPHEQLEAFNMFWNTYPAPKNKRRAMALWFASGCQHIAGDILIKLSEQVTKDRQFLEGYAPSICNYITDARWEDEVEVKKKPKSHYDNKSKEWAKMPTKEEDIFNEFHGV